MKKKKPRFINYGKALLAMQFSLPQCHCYYSALDKSGVQVYRMKDERLFAHRVIKSGKIMIRELPF